MVDILSQAGRLKRAQSYKKRLGAMLLFSFSISMFASVLLVGPFLFEYTKAKDAYEVEIVRIRGVLAETDFSEEEKLIRAQAVLLDGAQAVRATQPLSSVVEYITAAASGSVRILSMSLANEREIRVHGEAPNRQALVSFADALRATRAIAHVDVPIANFVAGVDAPFSISFVLKPYEK